MMSIDSDGMHQNDSEPLVEFMIVGVRRVFQDVICNSERDV